MNIHEKFMLMFTYLVNNDYSKLSRTRRKELINLYEDIKQFIIDNGGDNNGKK